ncbi:organic cation/carnitine transporter 3-like [Punica granatum]|uniref:Organic cation/carnitine transporter 3-like n=1 Tax=Punica granatum TaxID=22663 RepID=A0A218VQ39_PUNGR|nr:organic cation/carnitine transporter 3-like [Punica granatum]OWM62625.1 hypothetical protein CDL15_Pgr019919 [Punica granatum]
MSSSTPLLLTPESSSEQETLSEAAPNLQSLDELVEWCLGGFEWTQFFQAMTVSAAWFIDGQQAIISDFTDAEPTWHCTSVANTTCSLSSNACDLPASQWAWDGPSDNSIISDWALECASSFVTGLPTSSFYLGCLLGGFIFATLADSSLGRKNLLLMSCLVMSLAAFATAFSANIWMYSGLRLVSGLARASIGTCAIVLATEMVGEKWQRFIGMMGLFMETLGMLSLAPIAYALRAASWRNLYLTTSLLGIVYSALVYFFSSESPRWLLTQGREMEAVAVLGRIAPKRHNSLKCYVSSLAPTLKEDSSKVSLYSSMKDLFKTRRALKLLLNVMVLGFGSAMMYYGVLLGVGNFGYSIYLGLTLNGLLIIPSYFTSYFLMDQLGRKKTLLGSTTLSSVLSIAYALVRSELKSAGMVMELASFFCACMAGNVLFIYTVELFPTRMRNSATSMMRQSMILGILFDPILISAGRRIRFLTFLVFGLAIGLCGAAVIFLPETRVVRVSDMMDEEDQGTNNANGRSIN